MSALWFVGGYAAGYASVWLVCSIHDSKRIRDLACLCFHAATGRKPHWWR